MEMHSYIIEHKVNTVSYSFDPFEHRGYQFSPFSDDDSGNQYGGWIAKTTMEANNVEEADKRFTVEFNDLINRISFVSQCYTSIILEPFLIRRSDRPEFYLRSTEPTGPSALHFGEDELTSLASLENYQNRGDVFRCMNDANNTHGFSTRFSMLCAALEAIPGDNLPRTEKRRYIADEILKDGDLCKRIFEHKGGIRNQLLHGDEIDLEVHGKTPYVQQAYDAIVQYFNQKHGTKIQTDVVSAPRTLGGNYRGTRGWLKPTEATVGIDVELRHFCRQKVEAWPYDFMRIESPSGF